MVAFALESSTAQNRPVSSTRGWQLAPRDSSDWLFLGKNDDYDLKDVRKVAEERSLPVFEFEGGNQSEVMEGADVELRGVRIDEFYKEVRAISTKAMANLVRPDSSGTAREGQEKLGQTTATNREPRPPG